MPKLTAKQENFVIDVFKDITPSQSYLTHYKCKPSAAYALASRLLTNAKIKARLAELRKKKEDDAIADVQERQERLTEILRAKLTDFMQMGQDGSWINIGKETPLSGAIQEMHSTTEYDKDGSNPTVVTSIKLHDPVKAIDLLNKMDKLYSEGNVGNTLNVNVGQIEAKVINFDESKVARAIVEAIRLGLNPTILGGNGHSEDASLLPSSTDIQATVISESEN